jgi:hypothetical protein
MPKRHRLLLAGAAVLLLFASGLPAGRALYAAHDTVVSPDPADATPHVLDGTVDTILPMGNRVYVGGSFTQVRNADESRVIPRRGLFALDPATNKVDEAFVADFDVNPDRAQDRGVKALAAAPGDNELFVAGEFGTLNGAAARKLVKINAVTGAAVPAFDVSVSAAVKDLAINGSRLFLAGNFSSVGGQTRGGLAAVDATTGALDPDLDIAFTVPRQGNEARVETIAVSPDGATLVAGGNFTVAGGQTRWQVALVDVGARPAKVLDWQTNRFDDRDQGQYRCADAFDSHPRDIDVSPDGTYFVVVTTGAYTSRGSLCDTASRWELSARGSSLQPTWANFSGGDSFTAVAITGPAIYVGGHPRWLNNPKSDGSNATATAGPGSVTREGIAALDPASGLPLPWNPGRDRGEGAWAIASTPSGLWVGSDTDKIGGWKGPGCEGCEFHQKLAFFPLAGGSAVTQPPPVGLPAELMSVGPAGLVKRSFDGTTLGSPVVVGPGGDGGKVRGAVWIGGLLYEGRDDGRLLRWSYDGNTFGASEQVDLRGLPSAHQTQNAIVYGFPVANVTGMFYDGGRLYYTLARDRRLYYRYFLSQPNVADVVVGSQVLVASGDGDGLDWSRVQGMTAGGGAIFWSEGADLRRVDFAGGRPRPGTVRTVAQGVNLDARGLFLLPTGLGAPLPGGGGTPGGPPPGPPPGGVSPTAAAPVASGYWMVDDRGRVVSFGEVGHFGNIAADSGVRITAVDLEPTPTRRGYWIVDDEGRVYGFGDARYLGGVAGGSLAKGEKVTSMSTTRTGAGYWLFTTRGRALPFGDARHHGDMAKVTLNGPVLDSIPTPSGNGYYMVASDGGIFSFGDARFAGSMGGIRLNAPVQSLVPDPDQGGYWLVASDGGVFAFDAAFRGSMGDKKLNKPVTGMVPYGNGYLMVGEDGGIFNFSDRAFLGSLGARPPSRPIVSVAGF